MAALGLLAAACGDDPYADPAPERPTGTTEAAGGSVDGCEVEGDTETEPDTTVEVALTEWAVAPSPPSVPAGAVELAMVNQGVAWHHLVILRHDGDPGALPRDAVGGVDVTQLPDDAVVGETKAFLAGWDCRATFDLEPGSYALICNLVDDGSNPHYAAGMYAGLTVT